MSPEDRRTLNLFAARVREFAPDAFICAYGSRARGTAHPESDFDLCVVVSEVTSAVRDAVYTVAWDIGFAGNQVLAPLVLSRDDFERAPLSASTLVANIRRDGVAA